MIYELMTDTERIDESIKNGTHTIYAEESNLDEIECENVKKGFFDNVIYSGDFSGEFPNVEFYYSSRASDRESDYLLNTDAWPIVHKRVKEAFDENGITGIKYIPVKLIDVVTDKVNSNYYLMYIENFIDGIDLEKSRYEYIEDYDYYGFDFNGICLDEKICSSFDIFRCLKMEVGIYVSEKIKRIIESNGFIGFAFSEVPVS